MLKTTQLVKFSRAAGLVAVLLAWAAAMLLPGTVLAQSGSAYGLTLSRNFGYGNGSDIRGDMSLKIKNADDQIQSVDFRIDGQSVAAISSQPFEYRFNTNTYASGVHSLDALITLKDGSQVTTPARQYNFLSADQESAAMKKIFIPLAIIILGVTAVGVGGQVLSARKRGGAAYEPGAQRNYSIAGGSICRHCGRPTPRHIWGFNIVVGKFDRCENCGKWSVMRAYPLEILRAAETAEAAADRPQVSTEKSEEEKLRELLEKSKYDGQ